jgi:hypothetical protein
MATYWSIISHRFCRNCRINLGDARFFHREQGLADFGNMEGVNILNSRRWVLLGGINRCI